MEKLTREQVIERLKKGNKSLSFLDLSGLDLSKLDLSYVSLYHTNLSNTNLSHTDLHEANLFGANLFGANLYNTNLYHTNLESTNLYCAKLDEKEQNRKGLILKEAMIGYKKCLDRIRLNSIIVTLEIPKGAYVFSINNSKCRTNKAKVIEISNGKTIAKSIHNEVFTYELGQEIEIEDFDLRYNIECSTGIHFFRTREEAENY